MVVEPLAVQSLTPLTNRLEISPTLKNSSQKILQQFKEAVGGGLSIIKNQKKSNTKRCQTKRAHLLRNLYHCWVWMCGNMHTISNTKTNDLTILLLGGMSSIGT